MLFLITQTHTPGTCPIDAGGREVLHEKPENVAGLKIVAAYGPTLSTYYSTSWNPMTTTRSRSSSHQALSDAMPLLLPSASYSENSRRDWHLAHKDRRPILPQKKRNVNHGDRYQHSQGHPHPDCYPDGLAILCSRICQPACSIGAAFG